MIQVEGFLINDFGRIRNYWIGYFPSEEIPNVIPMSMTFADDNEFYTFLNQYYYDRNTETFLLQVEPNYTYSCEATEIIDDGTLGEGSYTYEEIDENGVVTVIEEEDYYQPELLTFHCPIGDTFTIGNVVNHEDLIIESVGEDSFTYENNQITFTRSEIGPVQIFLDHPHELSKTIHVIFS